MVNRFTVNNVTYTAKPFDFGLVCDLEEQGVSLASANKMGMSFVRAYFAVCADISKEEAAEIIQAHMLNGGSLDAISDAMVKEMNDSDFFRAISQRNEAREVENNTESATESTTEKKRGRKSSEN